MNYYNEFDPHAAVWLRELIARKLIPDGIVDERSITEINAPDLEGFTQCHFFAGIAGWPLALQLAGWPEDRPVWTGSCPCQPYSAAGKGLGDADPRNLWPTFFRLIRECRPDTVFGEQVESAIGHGWLDGIRADLEGENYALGDATLGAHSVSAPHLRQRLYWVAQPQGQQPHGSRDTRGWWGEPSDGSRLGDTQGRGLGVVGDAARSGNGGHADGSGGSSCGLADSIGEGLEGHRGDERDRGESGRLDALAAGSVAAGGAVGWGDAYWHLCRDGKHRRVPTEPALFPLADGLPYKLARRGSIRPALLKGAGNAIVPQVAAEFITAYLEVTAP